MAGDSIGYRMTMDAGGFDSGMKSAMASLGGMSSGVLSLGAVLATAGAAFAAFGAGIYSHIMKGGEFADMAKATGQSVANLVKLAGAFESVYGSSERMPTMLLMMQKALGGINEQGEPTAKVFEQMGLSIDALKSMDATESMSAILESLSKLGQEQAVFSAGKIFGRTGASEALLMARSMDEFADGLKESANSAAILSRSAEGFDKIDKSLKQIGRKSRDVFYGAAEGIAPAIQDALDKINQIDFKPLGDSFRDALLMGIEFAKQGLADYAFIYSEISRNSGLATKGPANDPIHIGSDVLSYSGAFLGRILATMNPVGIALSMTDKMGLTSTGLGEGLQESAVKSMTKNTDNLNKKLQKIRNMLDYKDLMDDEAAAFDIRKPLNLIGNEKESKVKSTRAMDSPNVNAWEKLGWNFNGNSSPQISEWTRKTADNTARLVDLWQKMKLDKMRSGDMPLTVQI